MSVITATRGDTIPISIVVDTSIAGATLFLTVRRYAHDVTALWEGETGDGITHTIDSDDDGYGHATARIPKDTSNDWPVGDPLPFDVQMKTSAGEIFTVSTDQLMLTNQITTRTS